MVFGFLSLSDHNRHPSSEQGQYLFAGASSTYYRGLVHQECHPQGKMTKQLGILCQTVRMILLSICQLLYVRSLWRVLDFDWFCSFSYSFLPLYLFPLLANMAAVSVAITSKYCSYVKDVFPKAHHWRLYIILSAQNFLRCFNPFHFSEHLWIEVVLCFYMERIL